MGIDPVPKYKSQARDYMATFLDGLRQFFRDFRQFVVMASRKFRLIASTAIERGVARLFGLKWVPPSLT